MAFERIFFVVTGVLVVLQCAAAKTAVPDNSVYQKPGQDAVRFEEAVAAAKGFLAAEDDRQGHFAETLRRYSGAIDQVVAACRRPVKKEYRMGLIGQQHFEIPSLRETYPEDLLFYYVPENYRPETPFGLLIFMHGGDRNTPREKAGKVISRGEDDPDSYQLRPFIEKMPFITVSASAPWSPECSQRWNLPEADDYIAAIIEESCRRFNIDKDRVILAGQSMGGFGAFHLGQRLGDRFAGVIMCAGAWKMSSFQSLIGTPIYIFHGIYDSAPGYTNTSRYPARPSNWSGISYARAADQLMNKYGVEHVFHEFEGGHLMDKAGREPEKFFQWMLPLKRNPYAKKVVVVTPRGSWHKPFIVTNPSPHSRWVSINQTAEGLIDYDKIVLTGDQVAETMEQFYAQGYRLETIQMPGSIVEAEIIGENTIHVKTQNVQSLSLWLHPAMVDFSRPVTVIVDGRKKSYHVQASLVDALRSYKRRQDWGLIYYAELPIDCQNASR